MTSEGGNSVFVRNTEYDTLLAELNSWLAPVEAGLVKSFGAPQWPTVFVVGLPRSGTTLLMQLLAASSGFSYPSNLLARFYGNLYIGARIEFLLKKTLPPSAISFSSAAGKTQGWNEPSEFGFFWEKYFPLQETHELSEEELATVDKQKLVAEIAALERSSLRPVAMKAMLLNFHLPFLHTVFPKAIFVRTIRDHLPVALSLLKNREKHFGGLHNWLSCKPRNWQKIAQQYDPIQQVAMQIDLTERALHAAEEKIPPGNWLNIPYEDLCRNPHQEIQNIAARLEASGHKASCEFAFPKSFPPSEGQHDFPDSIVRRLSSLLKKKSFLPKK